jgi:NCS1 family nucleobase:cation symporter-1
VLAAGAAPDVLDVGTTIAAAAGGGVVLLVLLVGESDQAMANVYSAAVSVQNIRPGWSQRVLIVAVGGAGLVLAAFMGADAAVTLESFLFLVGSVFVSLFGVFLAEWGIRARGRFGEAAVFDGAPSGLRWRALVPWALGFLVYQWAAPTAIGGWPDALSLVFHDRLGLPFPMVAGSAIGGSLPGFVAAFVATLLLRRSSERAAGGP